jgi:hypothetical protein
MGNGMFLRMFFMAVVLLLIGNFKLKNTELKELFTNCESHNIIVLEGINFPFKKELNGFRDTLICSGARTKRGDLSMFLLLGMRKDTMFNLLFGFESDTLKKCIFFQNIFFKIMVLL